VKSAPADVREAEVIPTVRELLGKLGEDQPAERDRVEAMLATVACHSVVRAGDVLRTEEARALLAAMDAVDFRASCPHGRPVLLRLSVAEIARRFGRT
jgi:DNA mismatch repair protein MutL